MALEAGLNVLGKFFSLRGRSLEALLIKIAVVAQVSTKRDMDIQTRDRTHREH